MGSGEEDKAKVCVGPVKTKFPLLPKIAKVHIEQTMVLATTQHHLNVRVGGGGGLGFENVLLISKSTFPTNFPKKELDKFIFKTVAMDPLRVEGGS